LVRVIAAVLYRDGKLLICRRPEGKRHGGLWEFPGGKVKEGESDFAAARRELAEELGISVTSVEDAEFSIQDPGSEFEINFVPVAFDGSPVCLEHSALAWVPPRDLFNYELAPSDLRYAQFLLEAEGQPSA
jgi:mutator protein MutT